MTVAQAVPELHRVPDVCGVVRARSLSTSRTVEVKPGDTGCESGCSFGSCKHDLVTQPERSVDDRCPGLLRPHAAADGALVRLRLCGGRIDGTALGLLGKATARFGDGEIQLTSRGNLQIRGIRPEADGEAPAELVATVRAAGLLPSPTHERVRNITGSPLSGIVGGVTDIRTLLDELDERLCAQPDLADLPGRFLFGIDDGRGDLNGLRLDLGARVVDPASAVLRVGELTTGPVPLADVPRMLVDLARGFLRHRVSAWHVAEMPHRGAELRPDASERREAEVSQMRYGPIVADDGRPALSAAVPLGILDASRIAVLVRAASGAGPLVITPWRGVVLTGLSGSSLGGVTADLAAAGFLLDEHHAWAGVTACTGAPKCPAGKAETRALASSIASNRRAGDLPLHVVGCERRCGAPAGRHTEVRAWEVQR